MTIELTPEHERLIEDAIQSGAYHDAKDVISAALEALARDQEPSGSFDTVKSEQRAAAIERPRTFGKDHGLSLGGMTVRQLRDESRP